MSDELFDEHDRETFEAAVDEWGIDAQADMAEEEAAEFIVASKHYARGKADAEDVIDELADLRIMYEQLSLFMGQERVEKRVSEKMDRLRERLQETDERGR
jgi:phosphoribosyl-ATP pyrophosphohydrolase